MRRRFDSVVFKGRHPRWCRALLWLVAALASSLPAFAADQQADAATLLRDGPTIVRIWVADRYAVGALDGQLDLWTRHAPEGYVLARVTAAQLHSLTRRGHRVEVDLARTLRSRRPHRKLLGQQAGIPGFPCYRTVEETHADLAQLAAQRPDLASWERIGDSWQELDAPGTGYGLFDLVLGNALSPHDKAPLVLVAAMHARELATAELATRFAEHLFSHYDVDPDVTWLLDHSEIHVVAHVNPDGRKEAEGGLLWRKNKDNDHCSNTASRGVDLNRNSSFDWGGPWSSSPIECEPTYRGPSTASEPETQAVEALMAAVFPDQRGPGMSDPAPDDATGVMISLHSFGNLVLFPWEGDPGAAPNKAGLWTLGRKFGFFNGYSVCQDCLYPASGTTVEVAYGEYGVAGYTFELGTEFFQDCSAFEADVLPNNLPALVYAAKAARRPYQAPLGPDVTKVTVTPSALAPGAAATLTALADDTRFDSNGQGVEPTQNVAAAHFSIDQAPWLAAAAPMTATDGAFDTAVEELSAVVDTSSLAPGRHTVFVTATDADGNTGVPSAVFLIVGEEVFADGFDSGGTTQWCDSALAAAVCGE